MFSLSSHFQEDSLRKSRLFQKKIFHSLQWSVQQIAPSFFTEFSGRELFSPYYPKCPYHFCHKLAESRGVRSGYLWSSSSSPVFKVMSKVHRKYSTIHKLVKFLSSDMHLRCGPGVIRK